VIHPALYVSVPPAPPKQSLIRHSDEVPDPSHYKLHTVAQTWDEGHRTCLSEGGHLLVLNSAEEFDVIMEIWDSDPDFTDAVYMEHIYVGLRESTENNFVTDSGKNIHAL
jgi:hypothetical protein